jgi:hypothetical protein
LFQAKIALLAEQLFYVLPILFHTDFFSLWLGRNTIRPWAGILARIFSVAFLAATFLTLNVPNPRSSILSPLEMASLIASTMLSIQAAVSRKESPVVLLAERVNAALFIIFALQDSKN